MKHRHLAAGVVMLAVATGRPVWAKDETARITIAGGDLPAPIAITDPDVLKQFNVWSGVGTGGRVNGVPWASTEGFIVEWTTGVVFERPPDLPRYEVSFYVNRSNRLDAGPAYVVFYEDDRAAGHGYVYLPGRDDPQFRRNVFAIMRGVEGYWFRATRAWQDAFSAAIGRTSP